MVGLTTFWKPIEKIKTSPFKEVKNLEGKLTAVEAQPIITNELSPYGKVGYLKNKEGEYMKFYGNGAPINNVLTLADKDKQIAKVKGFYKDAGKYYDIYGIQLGNICEDGM